MPERFRRMLNILLVVDCPRQRDALREAFAVSPHLQIVHEMGTSEAFACLFAPSAFGIVGMPDLLILDLPSSNEEGLQSSCTLLNQIKTQAAWRGIPVVLLGEDDTLRQLPESWETHLCAMARKPSHPVALSRMAYHFGEYWGSVARVPPRPDETPGSAPECFPIVPPLAFDEDAEEEFPPRKVEILVVDDNNDDAILFQESLLLATVGRIQITQILDDPETALEFLRKQGRFRDAASPDLVVLDIHMPRKTGFSLLEELKADRSLRRLPVVMLTASRFEEDIWESYSRGSCSFVEKPPRFEWFRELAQRFANYWIHVAHLPRPPGDAPLRK